MLFLAMLGLGAVIGFVGAGGAGVTISLLVLGFDVPVHTAVAVALAAMIFTMISGAVSHFREREVDLPIGSAVGIGGIFGAFAGAQVGALTGAETMRSLVGAMLCVSAVLLYLKVYCGDWIARRYKTRQEPLRGSKLWIYGGIVGLVNGFLSGAFGIGAAAFIQLALLVIFGLSLHKSIGTCMMIIFPISVSGGLGYFFSGFLDFEIFLQTLVGLMIGAYIGAKGTHLAPLPVLKFFIVALPAIGGSLLLLR